jgi:hypothetical protein
MLERGHGQKTALSQQYPQGWKKLKPYLRIVPQPM